jgi:hypothetical protein
MLFLVPDLPRSVGFLPVFFPPEPGLAQHPISRLPLPVDAAQFVTGLDQHAPDLLQGAIAAPALEPAMDRAVIAEAIGELVPLASGSEAEDDAVDRRAPVDPRSAAMGLGSGRADFQQDGFDPPPELVVDFPDRLKRLDCTSGPSQGRLS